MRFHRAGWLAFGVGLGCSSERMGAPDTGTPADTAVDSGAPDTGSDLGPPPDTTRPQDTAATDTVAADTVATDTVATDTAVDATPPDGGPSLVTYTELRTPCRSRNAQRSAFFGDLHVHTSLSFDAYTLENRNDTAAAYRFARGEVLRLPPLGMDGQGTRPARLDRPLDFAGVTDHSEFLGEVSLCTTPGSAVYALPACRAYREELTRIPEQLAGALAFGLFGAQLVRPMPERQGFCGATGALCATSAGRVWQSIRDAAEGAYDRTAECRFTSFVAYEWTGTTGGSNLHRNVIFRNAQVPEQPVSYMDQPTPEGLHATLRARCGAIAGCQVLAITHNANFGNGNLFPSTLDPAQAALRAELEPLSEVVQHKGASECNRAFSATDEACNFEDARPAVALCNGDGSGAGRNCIARQDYLRYVLQSGMAMEARGGMNPYRLGFIASTDTHNSTPGLTQEVPWPGHTGTNDDTPNDLTNNTNIVFSPGGLAGVWAVENSRDAIFEALRRRETFGTSGTRIRPRLFAGWGFPMGLCMDPELVARGYRDGVPMGGLLPPRPDAMSRPTFVVQATGDATPLQRVELVKVWLDALGRPQERVVVIAGSAMNGATVDLNTCTTTPGSGTMTLCGVWTDDQYDPAQRAAYYARVLENPTCRWSTPVCNALPATAPMESRTNCTMAARTVQDRAWTSPVWAVPAR